MLNPAKARDTERIEPFDMPRALSLPKRLRHRGHGANPLDCSVLSVAGLCALCGKNIKDMSVKFAG